MANPLNPIVYIIDDDPSFLTSLGRLLSIVGYNVETFSSARLFLDSVSLDAVGCVVSDIYMPAMDGFSLHQKMLDLGYRLPMIFMSAHANASDRQNALEQGAIGFLLKPFSAESLQALVQQAIGRDSRPPTPLT